MANAIPLCNPDTRIFPGSVPMRLGAQKHVRNMVYKLYNSNFNFQTDLRIPIFFYEFIGSHGDVPCIYSHFQYLFLLIYFFYIAT